MGHCKNIMMEMEEQGADFTGKYISPDCFSDSNLVKALTKLGNSGICSYSGKGGVVVPMNDESIIHGITQVSADERCGRLYTPLHLEVL